MINGHVILASRLAWLVCRVFQHPVMPNCTWPCLDQSQSRIAVAHTTIPLIVLYFAAVSYVIVVKSFTSHMGSWGGADLRFYSPQPDTSLHWKATNKGLVYHVACLFTPQLLLVPNYTAWWQAHRCEKIAQSFYAIVPSRDSIPRPLDRKSDILPQHHDAT